MGRLMSIFNAAISGNVEKVEKNLQKGVNINCVDKDGDTPLHIASSNGDIRLIKYLIQRGADVNFHTDQNYTPIEIAVMNQKIEAVHVLLESGANIKNNYCCAAHYASAANSYDILELLIDNGINVNGRDGCERTPLHWAAQEGFLCIAQLLIQKGGLVNVIDDAEQSPLYIATAENHLDIINLLLKNRAIPDLEKYDTPLMIACAYEHYEAADILLKAGANIDHKDNEGRTALFYAFVKKQDKMIKFLLKKGASSNIVDSNGVSIKDLSQEAIRAKLYDELF